MKTLDRYLMGYQAKVVLGILALFLLLVLMVQILEDLDIMVEHNATVWEAVQFYIYNLPYSVPQLLPYAFLLGSVLTAHHLVRKGEVAGMLAAGISPRRIFSGVLLLAAATSILLIIAWDRIAVPARQMSRTVMSQIKDDTTQTTERGIFTVLRDNRILHVQIPGSEDNPMLGVTLLEFNKEDGMRLTRRLDAARARPIESGQGDYMLEDVRIHRYPGTGAGDATSRSVIVDSTEYQIFESALGESAINRTHYKDMKLLDLRARIKRLEDVNEETVRYRYHFQERIAYPWNCFALALLGLIVPLRRRGMNIVLEMAIALILVVCFYIVQTFFETLGNEGTLNVVLCAWVTPVLFSVGAFWVLERTGQA